MLRVVARLACCTLIATLPATALATRSRAADCETRATYAGPALHAAVRLAQAPGELSNAGFNNAVVRHLDDAFTQVLSATAAPSISAAIAVPGVGSWSANRAESDAPLLYWASAGKAFTAVVILQLAEEGLLSLDDPASRWVDGVPNGRIVTVRDLLAHTSGLFSANEDLLARENPRQRSVSENLAIARRHGAMFCPGAQWRYSNTGYDVLGEIVRKVDGRSLEEAISTRIIAKLGLTRTRVLGPDSNISDIAPLRPANGRPIDPRWPGAAGPIAADAADMLRFFAALMNGRLLSPQSVASMSATLYPMFDASTYYGLGLMVFDVPDGDRRNLWLGHAGGTPGGSALLLYSPEDNAFVAVALTGNGPATAAAYKMLKAWREANR
ncbi:MAG: beta-lactamase family protein [Rhodanobacteraceae bacterium]|nr:beta-lactamase family protein [Rhodanobacteraceae bacterium]